MPGPRSLLGERVDMPAPTSLPGGKGGYVWGQVYQRGVISRGGMYTSLLTASGSHHSTYDLASGLYASYWNRLGIFLLFLMFIFYLTTPL